MLLAPRIHKIVPTVSKNIFRIVRHDWRLTSFQHLIACDTTVKTNI